MSNRKAFSKKTISVPEEYGNEIVLNVEFRFKSTYVKSIDHKSFEMTTVTDIEDYDGSIEASRYSRSEQLTCLGIICFFTYIPFTVYDVETSNDEVIRLSTDQIECDIDLKLNFNGENLTDDLASILKGIEEDIELTVTILDRIRKGLYLEKSSNDANLHHDEVFHIFFGIIELLADQYAREFRNKLTSSMETHLESFYLENLYYSKDKKSEIVKHKMKLVNDIIIREELNLKNRILYMCNKLDIEHHFLDDLVGNLIKERNRVAHGRTIYNDKVIWPLPPFFSLVDDSPTKLDTVFYFMTNIVQSYFDLNIFTENYESLKKLILPSKSFVKSLLNEPDKFNFTKSELIDGNEFNFTYETIFYLYVHHFNEMGIDDFGNLIKTSFLETEADEDNGPILLNLSILLSDSTIQLLRDKARENVNVIVGRSWFYWSNIKDAIRYLNYYNTKISWFVKWIREGGHIKCR